MRLSDFPNPDRRLEDVEVARLFIDPDYQRAANRVLAKTIAENFHWALFGVIIVAEREDGRLAVVDGQTRTQGAREAGVRRVPAVVLVGVTRQFEALLFAWLQHARKNIAAVDRFKADVFGGEPRAVEIFTEVDRRELAVSHSSGVNASRNDIAAVAALEYVYGRGGAELIGRVLDLLVGGFPRAAGRFSGEIIRSVSRFIIEDDPEDWRLVLALAEHVETPQALMYRSEHLRAAAGKGGKGKGGRSEGFTVQAIRQAYAETRTTKPRRERSKVR